jgi:hypothetical protein
MNPFFLNKTVGALTVSIAVFLTSVTGASYPGAILDHLANVVNGSQTQPVASLNAPNWQFGLSMTPPLITSIATTSGSVTAGLASSTPYTFAVAALDGTGTTTLISLSSMTTDASNTQNVPEQMIVKWLPVNGATGYAVFFSTSTTVSNADMKQYFYATTSGQFTFSTSTGSLAGTYSKDDTTAFSELLSPASSDIFNDNINAATSSVAASTTALQVNGTTVITASATTTACESDTAGAIFWNTANSHEWGCNGTTWKLIF